MSIPCRPASSPVSDSHTCPVSRWTHQPALQPAHHVGTPALSLKTMRVLPPLAYEAWRYPSLIPNPALRCQPRGDPRWWGYPACPTSCQPGEPHRTPTPLAMGVPRPLQPPNSPHYKRVSLGGRQKLRAAPRAGSAQNFPAPWLGGTVHPGAATAGQARPGTAMGGREGPPRPQPGAGPPPSCWPSPGGRPALGRAQRAGGAASWWRPAPAASRAPTAARRSVAGRSRGCRGPGECGVLRGVADRGRSGSGSQLSAGSCPRA